MRVHIDADRIGGARRDRTDDLLLAKQALSQLSYGPLSGAGPTVALARRGKRHAGARARRVRTLGVICEWLLGVNPFFGRPLPSGAKKTADTQPCRPSLGGNFIRSGGFVLHRLKNRAVGHLASADIQPVGKVRIMVKRGHTMLGKRQNMRQRGVVQRL